MPRKQTSPEVSALAARLLKNPQFATEDNIRTLAGSLVSQDETPGQNAMTEDEARALFPGETLEFNTLATGKDKKPSRRSISASWQQGNETLRQSVMIPNSEYGLGAAAHTLRGLVDDLKNEANARSQ